MTNKIYLFATLMSLNKKSRSKDTFLFTLSILMFEMTHTTKQHRNTLVVSHRD